MTYSLTLIGHPGKLSSALNFPPSRLSKTWISYRTQEMVEKKIWKEPRFLHLTIGNRPWAIQIWPWKVMIRRCSRDFCHFLAENTKNCIRHRKTKNQDFCILSYEIDHEQIIFAKKLWFRGVLEIFANFQQKIRKIYIRDEKTKNHNFGISSNGRVKTNC